MRAKKKISKNKTGKAKPKAKPMAKPGRTRKGTFKKGNKAAEKWTERHTLEVLQKMWDTVTEGHEDASGNFVRANDIKTIAEVCLIHDLDPDTWSYIQTKHEELKTISVLRLIKKIKWVIETRLVYAGGTMDMFILMNHYGYKDMRRTEVTGKDGGPIKTQTKQTIDYSKIPDNVLDALIAATSQDEE